jgi:hypothetical protein
MCKTAPGWVADCANSNKQSGLFKLRTRMFASCLCNTLQLAGHRRQTKALQHPPVTRPFDDAVPTSYRLFFVVTITNTTTLGCCVPPFDGCTSATTGTQTLGTTWSTEVAVHNTVPVPTWPHSGARRYDEPTSNLGAARAGICAPIAVGAACPTPGDHTGLGTPCPHFSREHALTMREYHNAIRGLPALGQ